MKVRNKRNGTNTIAYKIEGVTKFEVIPADSVVNLFDLNDFDQVINKQEFSRGWFEIIEEEENQVNLVADSVLEKAKKEAEEYSEEEVKKVKTKNK